MFCAIATTIERCKTEGVVDVFQVVKALRVQKPGAIYTETLLQFCYHVFLLPSLFLQEQYQNIFETVTVFLDSFANFGR